MTNINLPLNEKIIQTLKAGDQVLLNGSILTARDAAHKRLFDCIQKNQPLPVDIKNQIIYYVGACPPKQGYALGSCGPTTSSRMDEYTPALLNLGLTGTIGKGVRSKEVIDAIKKNHAVYFAAIGGAGALYSLCVKSAKILAYEDLGTECIMQISIENFPAIVAIDCLGNSIY